MISRHPKEFIYSQIDVMPIIDAAKNHDWNKARELLDSGYSLLWVDDHLKDSAMRILAKEVSDKSMISKLLAYSRDANGIDSDAHRFVTIEAIIGGVKNKERCRLDELSLYTNLVKYYLECTPLADMEDGDIGGLNADKEGYPVSADSIYYLCRGGRDELALKHLKWLYERLLAVDDHEQPRIQLYNGVTAIMRAAAQHGNIDMDELTGKVKAALKNQHNERVLSIAIAEGAPNGHEEWAFNHLDKLINRHEPDLDDVIGEAIISAARQGHADIIFKLCERASKIGADKTKRFAQLLSYSTGAALAQEHFALVKVLMHMVPEFNAKSADLKEINAWPEIKVKRMFHMIRDFKLFTNIALRAGVAKNVNAPNWIAALKKEYGLDEMSNEGFEVLVHDPDIIQLFLLQYKSTKDISPGSAPPDKQYFSGDLFGEIANQYITDRLTHNDIVCFIAQMKKELDPLKMRKHGDISFFRLRHLLDPVNEKTMSPEEMQHCIEVRKEISVILNDYINTKRYFGKDYKTTVTELREALYDAATPAIIRKQLEKHLAEPLPSLQKSCLQVLAKHQI